MNVDATIEALEQKVGGTPGTAVYRTYVEDKYMEQIRVRRKQTGVTHHLLWCISLGEPQQQAKVTFYGHRIKDVVKKAQEWAGLPTKTRNVKPNGQPPQPPAG